MSSPRPDQQRLLRWAESVRRDLPWRRTRDPWAILVSEVMLQQTPVERVVPKWERFVATWPDAASFAGAPLGSILDAWSGLGYPRRARYLWEAARQIRDGHDGEVPSDLTELLALRGVGPYTARAVLAFAHERDVAVLDTNVGRVLARRAGRRLRPAEAQAAADAWLVPGQSWEWNQGVLDLGSVLCGPRTPDCAPCPVRDGCGWAEAGRPEPDPAAGSAGVSVVQPTFAGSHRQARGRLLEAARHAPVPEVDWTVVTGREPAAAREAAESLLADGLAERDPTGALVLPGAQPPAARNVTISEFTRSGRSSCRK